MLNRREATLAIAALLAGAAGVGAQGQEAQPPRDATGRRPAERARGGAAEAFFVSPPLAKDDAEKRVLDVLAEMDRNRGRMQSVPMDDGRFLRLLAEFAGAQHVVEIGTSQGVSAIWFCLALRNTGGKLTTFEINPDRAELARANFKRAGVEELVSLVLGDAHEKVLEITESVDLLFLDADKPGYRDYLEKLFPKLRPGGLVVAHNIDPRMADPAFVKTITTDSRLDSLLVHLQAGGISVSLRKRGSS
ncbi:class I SAM-dependent methyltransferase [bacterium]|nr:class I SAM-dependent methyltransferase [bacterium]